MTQEETEVFLILNGWEKDLIDVPNIWWMKPPYILPSAQAAYDIEMNPPTEIEMKAVLEANGWKYWTRDSYLVECKRSGLSPAFYSEGWWTDIGDFASAAGLGFHGCDLLEAYVLARE